MKPLSINETKLKLKAIILLATMLCLGCGEPNWVTPENVKKAGKVKENYEHRLAQAGVSNFMVYVTPADGWKFSPLVVMEFTGHGMTNLPPLDGMHLYGLMLRDTEVSDLSPLKGIPLEGILIRKSPITDLSPLKGAGLKRLSLQETSVADLSPLKGMKLELVLFEPKNITNGIDIIRNMPSLIEIGTNNATIMPPAEFWAKFDAGEFD